MECVVICVDISYRFVCRQPSRLAVVRGTFEQERKGMVKPFRYPVYTYCTCADNCYTCYTSTSTVSGEGNRTGLSAVRLLNGPHTYPYFQYEY